jgi:hypothetical protein
MPKPIESPWTLKINTTISRLRRKLLSQLKTEETTKNALIIPFIQVLSYDVFNPFEVNPDADIRIKNRERYCVFYPCN